ncbi:MAG TPA: SpoIIE family protein phosphatase [Candidatus Acidoferrales bacterium]|nr:SpoIIE family protein phosphatase [Candidatus Acidoferrales bacterium]
MQPVDLVALAIAVLYVAVWLVRIAGHELPLARLIEFCFFLSLGYFIFRFFGWARSRLLWSLRNRLIVAYIFIAVVPVVMLLAMAAITAEIVYSQLGGYLLVQDIESRVEKVAEAADSVASGAGAQPAGNQAPVNVRQAVPAALQAHLVTLESAVPGLEVDLRSDGRYVALAGKNTTRFQGIVQSEGQLWLLSESRHDATTVVARAPVTPTQLDAVAPYLGPVQLVLTHPATNSDEQGSVLSVAGEQYGTGRRISTGSSRALQAPSSWMDFRINGFSKLDAVLATPNGLVPSPIFASFSARRSQLDKRLFASLGDLSSSYIEVLLAVGLVFLILEIAALITGVVLTRTITRSVADMYSATQYVKAGDFSHRVRVERADQLGSLAESFNAMAGSVNTLIEEQKKRQRLENEISIAHEVQTQLFPRILPKVEGVELDASCRAARGVSGDYYDFIQISPTRLGIALADISGKGISAALLMASVQAALRSQLLQGCGDEIHTGEIVGRINQHLFLATAEDRFATFFFAVYDAATRKLHYTNAGHLPPFFICGDKVEKLEAGGTVIGVFDSIEFEEGVVEMQQGSLLVAFSDGLVEPENVYGEEFGSKRLCDVAVRSKNAAVHAVVENLLGAPEQWAGTAEQADDMTVVVLRVKRAAASERA